MEAPGAICRERINNSSPVRRIAGLSKSKCQTQIICRAGLIEINERRKISLVGAELEVGGAAKGSFRRRANAR